MSEVLRNLITPGYFYLRQRLPIFIYVFYLHFKKSDKPIIKTVVETIIALTSLGMGFLCVGMMFNISFKDLLPLDWQYAGLITWGVLFISYYLKAKQLTHNELTAFTFAMLACVGGGWLWEVPIYHPLGMFLDSNTIFFINGQIVCCLLLAYELKKLNFKTRANHCVTFIIFLVFSTILYFNMQWIMQGFNHFVGNTHFFKWVIRFPACLFLYSLLEGIEK